MAVLHQAPSAHQSTDAHETTRPHETARPHQTASPHEAPSPCHRGACLCGAVAFTIDGPLPPIQVCHCAQCRRAQGGPFATNIPVEAARLRFESGEAQLQRFESSPGKRRVFCARCGSPVFSERDSLPGIVRIRAGLIDEPLGTRPGFHAHVASACDWWPIADGLPRHAGGYAPGAERPDPAP